VEHLQAPADLNALFDRRGVDAVCVPLHVTAEHFAATVAGMRHLRNFAGDGVSIPHKAMAARLCDALLPNARACGVVNIIRIAPDGRWIGEIFDGIGMAKALTAQRPLDANTRVLLVGAIAVALALAGVGYMAITNRSQAKAEAVACTVRSAVPTCVAEAEGMFDPATFDVLINATGARLTPKNQAGQS
jgi:shikimate dehydrogenase